MGECVAFAPPFYIGDSMKKPASKIDGTKFYNAAVRNNLPTDNRTLNKIVKLVNEGMSVSAAAKQVASKVKSK